MKEKLEKSHGLYDVNFDCRSSLVKETLVAMTLLLNCVCFKYRVIINFFLCNIWVYFMLYLLNETACKEGVCMLFDRGVAFHVFCLYYHYWCFTVQTDHFEWTILVYHGILWTCLVFFASHGVGVSMIETSSQYA